jgi:hypothetical protein
MKKLHLMLSQNLKITSFIIFKIHSSQMLSTIKLMLQNLLKILYYRIKIKIEVAM